MIDSNIIQLRGVSKVFTTQKKKQVNGFTALQNINLQIKKGEFVSLVGPSGCGKSTVLNLASGLTFPSVGQIFIHDKEVNKLSVGIGYITQDDNLFPWRTMIDNVAYGLEIKGMGTKERYERSRPWIEKVGLQGFENHFPHQLSGGMRKRAAILRTLVLDPEVILMDEPFGPLDAQTRILLQQDLLNIMEGSGKTVVFVTHDLSESIALSDRVVVFTRSPGRIKSVYPIHLPRPRDVIQIQKHPDYGELREKIWLDIRSELDEAEVAAH